MLKYNICFIRQGNRILLINRNNPSWMGCWNGIGGRLEQGETPRQSMVREISEETGIPESAYRLRFAGIITWSTDSTDYGGMYTYTAELDDEYQLTTPIGMEEGILDWKPIYWIMHPSNQGVAKNIPLALPDLLEGRHCIDLCSIFEGNIQVQSTKAILDPLLETDEALRESYLIRRRNEIAVR
jgi:8-oxo-dGTP diphosphatase